MISEFVHFFGCVWCVLQVVWIDRVTGRVCMSVSAKGMAITGIEDRRYWNWIPTEESRLANYLSSTSLCF